MSQLGVGSADDLQQASIRAAIRAAIADVDAAEVSREDRAVVLGVVLAKRVGLAAHSTPATPDGGRAQHLPQEPDATNGRIAPPDDGLVGRIAGALKVSRDVVDLVYDDRDGELGVVVSARRLADDKANATRQLAQIVAVGRQAAGLEEWTPVGRVREVVSDYGKLDSANFASYVQRLDKDNVCLMRGKGANRELKVTRSGMESIAEMLTALVATQ